MPRHEVGFFIILGQRDGWALTETSRMLSGPVLTFVVVLGETNTRAPTETSKICSGSVVTFVLVLRGKRRPDPDRIFENVVWARGAFFCGSVKGATRTLTETLKMLSGSVVNIFIPRIWLDVSFVLFWTWTFRKSNNLVRLVFLWTYTLRFFLFQRSG